MKKQLAIIFLFLFLQVFSTAQCWETAKAGFAGGTAIRTDGTLWAWGQNDFGALGDGTYINKNKPIKINFDSNWNELSTGNNNGAIVKKDGSLWVWGYQIYPKNNNDSTFLNINTPTAIDSSKNWRSVSVLNNFLAIKNDGTLWSWGGNEFGQLGDGTIKPRNKPKQIGTDNDWQSVSSGYYYSFGFKKNGTLWIWGLGRFAPSSTSNNNKDAEFLKPTQIGTAKDWKSIHFFRSNCVALKDNGTLWTWDTQLEGGIYIAKNLPIQIGKDMDWYSLSTGMYGDYIHAIKNNGSLWAWGGNRNGQLGDGTFIERENPIQISTSYDWKSVSSGGSFSIGIKQDGTIWTWGSNTFGQTGTGQNIDNVSVPTIIPTFDCIFQKPKTIEPFNLFPNPSSGFITIKGEDTDNADILIYNLVGQLVKTTKLKNKTFDVSELASGAYLLHIRTENQVLFAKKIIKI